MREIVESATVEKAALNRNDSDLAQLKQSLVDMEKAVTDGTSGEKADLQFHLAIAKAAKNTLLVELLNNISGLIQDSMEETRKIFIYSAQKQCIVYMKNMYAYIMLSNLKIPVKPSWRWRHT